MSAGRPSLSIFFPAYNDVGTIASLALSSGVLFAQEPETVITPEDLAQEVPSICPLPVGTFVLTSPFGNRTSPFTNAVDFHSGLDLAALNVTVSSNCDAGNATESVTVDVDYDYKLISPLGGLMSFLGGGIPSTITLSSSADMRME